MQNPVNWPAARKFYPGIAWFILVGVLICLPGSKIPPVENWLNTIYYDKWIHAGLFGVLTFLFIRPLLALPLALTAKKNWAVKITLAACIWALTTEFIQKFFIPDRSFDLFDVAADTLGIITVYAWCRLSYLK